MKSKQQKSQELIHARTLLEKAHSLIFVDFSKTPVSRVNELKATLRSEGGLYKVMKKRLYKILFQEKNIQVDMEQFGSQFAAIFSDKDISDPAGITSRFAKQQEKEGSKFMLLGGADIISGIIYSKDEIQRIGQLPSREILLAQLLGTLHAPMSRLAYVLGEIGKQK